MSKNFRVIATFALVLCFGSATAFAQKGPSFFIGAGAPMDSSSNAFIDTFGTGTPFQTPKLTGAFGKIGGEVMVTPHYGFGIQTDFRLSRGEYTGLNYRPLFYDFNMIYTPAPDHFKKVVPEFQGGIGGASLKFYVSQSSSCSPFSGCAAATSTLVDSSKHFQLHAAAGLKIYAMTHLFFRPQLDLRYVPNFFQFGRNLVPEYGASIGWTFGER